MIDLLLPYAVTFGLLLARTTALLVAVPALGGESLPGRLRAALAGLFAVLLTIKVGGTENPGALQLGLLAGGEFLLGMAMGLCVRLVMIAAELAGELAGMQMGFAFNRVVDPMTRESGAVTSRLYGMIAMALFIGLDGPRLVIAALTRSVDAVPAGAALAHATSLATVVELLQVVSLAGLRIAAPIVTALLLTNVAVGLLSRAAPQLNLFVMAFGISIGVGMFMMASAAWPSFSIVLEEMRRLPEHMSRVLSF